VREEVPLGCVEGVRVASYELGDVVLAKVKYPAEYPFPGDSLVVGQRISGELACDG
jgi:hypothetical protein